MQKFIPFLLATCLYGQISAQNISDVLFMNSPVTLGTPRFTATSGAFTALGNSFSATHVNPAGLAVFRHDELGVTMGYASRTVKSTFYGSNQTQNYNGFIFTNIGYVKKFMTKNEDVTWNLGISYNRNSDLNQESQVLGVNPSSSILQSWIANANGTAPGALLNNGLLYEALAFEAYLIDPDFNNNYSTQAQIGSTEQFWSEQIKGHFDELSFAVGVDKENKLYYGGSLNIPFYRYDNAYYYSEAGYGGDSIKGLEWRENFSNRGAGINVKLGAIYRPIPNLRLGASIWSPTWLGITQTYSTSVNSIFYHSTDYLVEYVQDESFSYSMRTAPQGNLGLAYVFNKNGFISVDYAFIPLQWSGTGTSELSYLNSDINSSLNNQHNLRFGAEIRAQNFFFRGGYSWLSNPYNIKSQDAARNTISLGLGYRTNKFNFDLSYAVQRQSQEFYPYNSTMVEASTQTLTKKPLLLSVSFKL